MDRNSNSNRSKMLSNLFMERKKFILLGLTGRTGSGCTTAATLLEDSKLSFPDVSDINYMGKPFYDQMDARRYQVLKKYSEKNFRKFFSIKVSDLITAYFLQMEKSDLVDFVAEFGKGVVGNSQVQNGMRNCIIFNKSTCRKITPFASKILDHAVDLKFSEKEIKNFVINLSLIRNLTNKFKEDLKKIHPDLYIFVYQAAGNSIRKIGFIDKNFLMIDFDPEKVFHLPETINRVIKILRKTQDHLFIVIDAIRNPYEARFFKDRYSAFYLASVNAPDEDRRSYLQNVHKFTVEKFDEIERRESGKTKIQDADFISQNVKACVEMADIHLFNPRNEIDNHNILKAQLAWYFSLMVHPGLVSPRSVERVMQIAYTAKTNSGCISRQVGAVITDKNFSVKAIGWNDVAKGQIPCSLRSLQGLLNNFDQITYSEFERNNSDFRDKAKKHYEKIIMVDKDSGRNHSYCFKDIKNSIDLKGNQVHTRSLHAEENAFLQITKYGGVGIEGGKLFTTASPCELCAKKAYQLGIEEIVYIDPYPGISRDHILSIGINPPKLTQFMGAVGKGYFQLYEPILSFKDELNYLVDKDDE